MEKQKQVAIIILAAGSSSRLGTSKQLLEINSIPLLLKTAQTAIQTHAHRVVVILGSSAEQHKKIVEHLPVDIVVNENWNNGMGSSIKSGIKHLIVKETKGIDCLITVCDQPLLTTEHLNTLILAKTKSHKGIVASLYAGAPGVPVLFSKSYLTALLNISDSEGAKGIIKKNINDVELVPFPQGSVDIDTQDDVDSFARMSHEK